MKKNILFFGALVGALLLVSCSGGNKKQAASSVASEELDNASKVINYYHTSLIVLRHVANAKDINAVWDIWNRQEKFLKYLRLHHLKYLPEIQRN